MIRNTLKLIYFLTAMATLCFSSLAQTNIAKATEFVEFGHALQSSSKVVFERKAFSKKVEKVTINGKEAVSVKRGNALHIKPAKTWKAGINTVEVTASGRKYTMYVSFCRQTPVKVVYGNKNSTINGNPFLPLAIYAVPLEDISRAKAYGFNLIQNYQMQRADYPMDKYLNTAAENKLYVFLQFSKKNIDSFNYKAVMKRVGRYMSHPALWGWYLYDEPSSKKIAPAQIKFFNDMLHKLDPYHPVLTSNWEQGKFKEGIDVDLYQFYQGPPSRMSKTIKRYTQRAKNEWKFNWCAILNTHDSSFGEKGRINNSPATFYSYTGNDKKQFYPKGSPSYKKAVKKARKVAANLLNPPFPFSACFPRSETIIRGQAFDAIAHGSNGLFWWLWSAENKIGLRWGWYTVFHQPELRAAMKKLLKDLRTLSPYIIDSAKDSKTWYAGKVFFWKKKFKQGTVIIAVNESEQKAECKITGGSGKLYIFGSDKVINNGSFTDKLNANEARVYSTFKISIKSPEHQKCRDRRRHE